MDGKRKKLKVASELDSNLATSRIGRELRGKVGRTIQVIYDACEMDVGKNKSKAQIMLHTTTKVGDREKYLGEGFNRGGPIINLMLSTGVKEVFNRDVDPKDIMNKFAKSLEESVSSVTLEVLLECKMLAGEHASSIPSGGSLRYNSTVQQRFKFLEFDCKLDPINMIMLKNGIDFVYLTAKFTIDMKPPVD